jgi:hypothetical protein
MEDKEEQKTVSTIKHICGTSGRRRDYTKRKLDFRFLFFIFFKRKPLCIAAFENKRILVVMPSKKEIIKKE